MKRLPKQLLTLTFAILTTLPKPASAQVEITRRLALLGGTCMTFLTGKSARLADEVNNSTTILNAETMNRRTHLVHRAAQIPSAYENLFSRHWSQRSRYFRHTFNDPSGEEAKIDSYGPFIEDLMRAKLRQNPSGVRITSEELDEWVTLERTAQTSLTDGDLNRLEGLSAKIYGVIMDDTNLRKTEDRIMTFFRADFAKAESELSPEFGTITDVQRAVAMLSLDPKIVVNELLGLEYPPDLKPVYSERLINALAEKVTAFAPNLGATVKKTPKQQALAVTEMIEHFHRRLGTETPGSKYMMGERFFKFMFKAVDYREHFTSLTRELLMPHYATGLATLHEALFNLRKFPDSNWKNAAYESLIQLQKEMQLELVDVPRKLRAYADERKRVQISNTTSARADAGSAYEADVTTETLHETAQWIAYLLRSGLILDHMAEYLAEERPELASKLVDMNLPVVDDTPAELGFQPQAPLTTNVPETKLRQ